MKNMPTRRDHVTSSTEDGSRRDRRTTFPTPIASRRQNGYLDVLGTDSAIPHLLSFLLALAWSWGSRR